jgi:hypothetical protein
MKCSACKPDYCACADHFSAWRAFQRGGEQELRKLRALRIPRFLTQEPAP